MYILDKKYYKIYKNEQIWNIKLTIFKLKQKETFWNKSQGARGKWKDRVQRF